MGHERHHKKRSSARTAARIILVLTVMTFAGAIVHFSYTAYQSGQCYTADAGSDSMSTKTLPRRPIDSGDCRQIIASADQQQRIDAVIAVLAIMLMIGAAVRLSKASRRARKLILVAEIFVVAIGGIYAILVVTALR